jgi:hypothetical protein
MWENAFYVGGSDDGVIEADGLTVGAALCWELMRTQTVRRLRGRIDLALTGSGWWSMSENWLPRSLFDWLEAANHRRAVDAAASFALYAGAPVVHAANAGELRCATPWLPLPYRGNFEGGTLITDERGLVLAALDRTDGEGFAIAEVEPRRIDPLREPPDRFWLHERGAATLAWHYQRLHGRPWYRKHVRGRAPRTAAALEGNRGQLRDEPDRLAPEANPTQIDFRASQAEATSLPLPPLQMSLPPPPLRTSVPP